MIINNISAFRKAVRNGPFAWPGGYPLYFITSDDAALCCECGKTQRRYILESLRDSDKQDGWNVCGLDVNWEEPDLICAHCNKPIQAAYGEV